MGDRIKTMKEDGLDIASAMHKEQKHIQLSGIDVVFGPVTTDPAGKSIVYQLYLPKIEDSLVDPIRLPDDPKIQKQVLDNLPKLAQEASNDPNKLHDSISRLIRELMQTDS